MSAANQVQQSKDVALSPKEISAALSNAALAKSNFSALEESMLGVLAGIYIGFGAFAAVTVQAGGGMAPGLARFLGGSVFAVGLMLVMIPGSELFTGNILMSIGMVQRRLSMAKTLRNWILVYIGNFLGSLLLAWAIAQSGLLGTPDAPSAQGQTIAAMANMKMGLPFAQAMVRGVLCNMLVCLAVIMAVASPSVIGKIFAIYFPIMVFVMCGYEHSIANMFLLPGGLMAQGKLASDFLAMFRNLIPVTIGNIIGGLLVVIIHPKHLKKLWLLRTICG